MNRTQRLAILTAAALLLLLTGGVLATRGPAPAQRPAQLGQDGEDADSAPTAEDIAHAAERLAENELEVSDELLTELAGAYGVGGAVRIVAWSEADPDRMADIRAMRDGDGSEGSAMGWGQIAKELGVHPGIGTIMGAGEGHGREGAPGQQGDDTGD